MAFLLFTLFATFSVFAPAAETNYSQNLQMIDNIFHENYAPLAWKESFSPWTLESEVTAIHSLVLENPAMPLNEFQTQLSRFFSSTKDYHVAFRFYHTEAATLPFMIRSAEGRYFFVDIDRDKLPLSSFPVAIGDELLAMNGLAPAALIAQLKAESFSDNVPATDQAMMEVRLTSRSAQRAMKVPQGPVDLKIRKKDGTPFGVRVIWDYTPEKILQKKLSAPVIQEPANPLDPQMSVDLIEPQMDLDNTFTLGARISFIPRLGIPIWQSEDENPFDAYIFQAPDKSIVGYVRISSYSGTQDHITAFRTIIEKMQSTTDKLVIDEINNPGGGMYFMYSLLSMLNDKPIQTPKYRISLNQEGINVSLNYLTFLKDVNNDADAVSRLGNSIGGYPVSYELTKFLTNYHQFRIDQWNAGKRMTEPTHMGIDVIAPNPVHYTKPILVLINEMDFSGGDFFPAILQDNQRATLMGTRTAGAGGVVMQVRYPNSIGLEYFSYTGSIAERMDLTPIENLGVIPDIEYHLTVNDMQNGFVDYKKAILRALKNLK